MDFVVEDVCHRELKHKSIYYLVQVSQYYSKGRQICM